MRRGPITIAIRVMQELEKRRARIRDSRAWPTLEALTGSLSADQRARARTAGLASVMRDSSASSLVTHWHAQPRSTR